MSLWSRWLVVVLALSIVPLVPLECEGDETGVAEDSAAASTKTVSSGSAWYVDGRCTVGGDGTTVEPCADTPGGRGPFKAIAVGVKALGPGGTLYVRGAHDGFDGVYRGEYLGIYGEDHLDCRASPCTIRGYASERPVISGFKRYDDWRRVSPGSAVWFRDMEWHGECEGMANSGGQHMRRDPDADWDPQIVVQDRSGVRAPLQYDDKVGDARFVEQRLGVDGSWWHDLRAHRSYVNPHGNGDPNHDADTILLVPQEQAFIVIEGSGTCGRGSTRVSHNVLFKQLDMEGARSKFVEVNGLPDEYASDIRFEDIAMRFMGGKYAMHTMRVARFAVAGATVEWIGRGVSWPDHGHAFRTFRMNGATLDGITCRHFGTDNRGQRGFIDRPWANARTSWWWGGTCIQVKQSNDVVIRDLVAEDLSLVAVAFDVSRRSVLERFRMQRVGAGVALDEAGAAPRHACTASGRPCTDDQACRTRDEGTCAPCDPTNETHFCHNYDLVVRSGSIHASGTDGSGAIVTKPRRDKREKLRGDQFTLRVYNVAISYPAGAVLRVADIERVSLWNVSAYGQMADLFPGGPFRPSRGVVLTGDVRRFESRNNIFAQLGDVAIDVGRSVAADTVSFDHDVFDLRGRVLARWGGSGFRGLEGPGGLRSIGQERRGRVGAPRFRDVPGSLRKPPDLHPAPGGVVAAMGETLARHFMIDADGRARRSWDAGAYVVPDRR